MISERTSRTEMLIGEEAVAKLRSSHVAVFGVGGVGGYTVEALARAGVGAITVIDGDAVSESNINRQIIATYESVGRRKVEAVAERILTVAPDCRVTPKDVFYASDTADEIDFASFDYAVDAIDTVSSKLLIIKSAKAAGVPVISCMGTGNKLDPLAFRIADIKKTSVCPLAREMRRLLREHGVDSLKVLYSEEVPKKPLFQPHSTDVRRAVPSSISFVPSAAGLILAGEVIRDLIAYGK